MRISHAVVITPGGIGTLLELFYTWQLMQVDHIRNRPFLLLGPEGMWDSFLEWLRKWPLAQQLMSQNDFDRIKVVDSVSAIVAELEPDIKRFHAENPI
jgi:predicted Rossmann-fold nucleotide-binding protein